MTTNPKTILNRIAADEFETHVRDFTKWIEEYNAADPQWGPIKCPRLKWTEHDGAAVCYTRNIQHRDRYHYDGVACTSADDWHQFDTESDAWYHGVWYNPDHRIIVSFCEGDETVTICSTPEAYNAELRGLVEFYGAPPPAFIAIDNDGTVTKYFDEHARPEVF